LLFLPTGVITVKPATSGKEKSMSENAIDSVKATPDPAAAKPKRKPGNKAKSPQESGPGQEVGRQLQGGPHQKEAEVIAMMKRRRAPRCPRS
jgi:hypothetical protein